MILKHKAHGLFLLLFCTAALAAQERGVTFYSLWLEESELKAHVQINNLIDEDMINGLQKGMTTTLEYEVQLWEDRTFSDRQVSGKYHRMKLSWDPWSKRYVVETRDNRPLLLSESDLVKRCSRFPDLRVAPAEKIKDNRRYYVALRITIRPMSVDNMNEITRWLKGEVKEIDAGAVNEAPPSKKKTGSWIMGLVLNVTGFGDRMLADKSPRFYMEEGELHVQHAVR